MSTGFTFPLALCKAQWSVWLHAREMLQTSAAQCLELGAQFLRDSAAGTRAETGAITQAEDWQALSMVPVNAFWRAAGAPGGGEVTRAAASDRPAAEPVRAADGGASRQAVVADALRSLNTALASASASRRKKP